MWKASRCGECHRSTAAVKDKMLTVHHPEIWDGKRCGTGISTSSARKTCSVECSPSRVGKLPRLSRTMHLCVHTLVGFRTRLYNLMFLKRQLRGFNVIGVFVCPTCVRLTNGDHLISDLHQCNRGLDGLHLREMGRIRTEHQGGVTPGENSSCCVGAIRT